jgi:hypothetical protein
MNPRPEKTGKKRIKSHFSTWEIKKENYIPNYQKNGTFTLQTKEMDLEWGHWQGFPFYSPEKVNQEACAKNGQMGRKSREDQWATKIKT